MTDLVEGVIGDAVDAVDAQVASVDVVDLVGQCVLRAQLTAGAEIRLTHTDCAVAAAAPVALSRAVSCVLDNAVRAAGPGGHVAVDVTHTAHEIIIQVTDDGPGPGHVPTHNSLGLTITRALVSACRGGFELKPDTTGGAVARITIPVPTLCWRCPISTAVAT